MEKWDAYAVKKTAEDKHKEAMQKSIQKSIQKGIQQGAEQKTNELVKNLIGEFGFTDEQTAKAANISISDVKKIRIALKRSRVNVKKS